MASYPRKLIIFDHSTFHVTWKCHNEDWLLSSNYAKKLYYSLLLKYKNLYQIQIFSYCLMDNHPHIVGTCKSQQLFSDFFRVVNSLFAKKMNRYLDRKGQVVMDRFKSINIKTEKQLMAVMFYNDLNPFRTIKQTSPEAHQWSSHKHYAYGKKDPLITETEWYLELGDSETKRQKGNHLILRRFKPKSVGCFQKLTNSFKGFHKPEIVFLEKFCGFVEWFFSLLNIF